MYKLNVSPKCEKIFVKLARKNPEQLKIIDKKVLEIRSNPFHEYKSLSYPFQGRYRIHIDKSFVLIFCIDHNDLSVTLLNYNHHDYIYK
jgi:mRNA-degrading endonuclease RelE of RelBE toxin-antitoxin system